MDESKKRKGEEPVSEVWKKVKIVESHEENFINLFAGPPSLQSIAITSIAIRMWSCAPIDLIENNYTFLKRKKLEDIFLNQLDECILPKSLKTDVYNVLQPIGDHLKEFLSVCRFHSLTLDSNLVHGSVYWTMEGTIDVIKSLGEILNKENPEKKYHKLYKLACKYCLEDYIPKLWVQMPNMEKNKFNEICQNCGFENDDLFAYWTFAIRGELHKMGIKFERSIDTYDHNLNTNENMVSWSIVQDNFYALKYFWRKLSEQEKSDNVGNWLFRLSVELSYGSILNNHCLRADIFCFLLSQLSNEKLQGIFLRRNPSEILNILFKVWPYQRFFLLAISKMWDYLQKEVYISLLTKILSTFELGKKSNNDKLFRETWRITPSRLKNAYLEDLYKKRELTKVLLQLVKIGSTEMAVTLLNETSSERKKLLISKMLCDMNLKTFFIAKKDPTLIEPLFKAILHSDGDLQKFKKEMVLTYIRDTEIWLYHGNFPAVDTFLKWGFQCEDEIKNLKKDNFDPYEICTNLMCSESILEKFLFDHYIFIKEPEKMYDLVDQVLCWYFDTEKEILEFKKTFVHEKNFCFFMKVLCDLCNRQNIKEKLEKFKNFMFTSSEEIIEFKKLCIKCIEHAVDKLRFRDAFNIFNWCLDSDEKVNQFKIDVLLSDLGYKMLLPPISCFINYHQDDVLDVIKKSFPLPKETITALKLSLNRDTPRHDIERFKIRLDLLKGQRRKAIFNLLDKLEKEYGK